MKKMTLSARKAPKIFPVSFDLERRQDIILLSMDGDIYNQADLTKTTGAPPVTCSV